MSLDTISLFDNMELDDTQHRVASRRALALAHHRIESNLGKFLRGARSEEEFMERLGLVADDFAGYVNTAATEVGYGSPEHTAAALRSHYAVSFEKTPAEEEEEEQEEEQPKPKNASTRRWQPLRVGAEGKQSAPLGGNPHDIPGTNFYNQQGQPEADPMRNQQGYIRPGVPMGVGERDEGYEQAPYGVDPNLQPGQLSQRDYGNDQGLQVGPNLPPVEVPPQYPNRYQGKTALVPFQQDLETERGRRINPALQQDTSPNAVTCPECGGTNPACPKCGGRGQVPNFGSSVLDAVAKTAEDHGNTDLGGPEPKMDKGEFKHTAPEVPGKIKEKDILKPIIMHNTDHDELEEIGDIEKHDLPAADGDDAGFASNNMSMAPHTDTFGNDGQVDPVTREALSHRNPLAELLNDPWPSDAAVEAAFRSAGVNMNDPNWHQNLQQTRQQAQQDPRVQAVQQWAQQNYQNGADVIVEAFEPDEILQDIVKDARTPEEAIQRAAEYCRLHRGQENDVRGYGGLDPLPNGPFQ